MLLLEIEFGIENILFFVVVIVVVAVASASGKKTIKKLIFYFIFRLTVGGLMLVHCRLNKIYYAVGYFLIT